MTINPITPVRILDTRPSKGGAGPFAAGETRTLQILGAGAVPLSGVAAIVGNATAIATNVPNTGHLTIWPAGHPMPLASNVNHGVGGVLCNQFIVPLGPGGAINLFSYAAALDVIVDVQGWIRAPELAPAGPTVALAPAVLAAVDSVKAVQVLAGAVRYAMSTWWPGPAQTLLATTLGQALAYDEVRRLAMAALGVSTALATGVYDPASVGVSAQVATDRVVQLVDRVASQHVTSTAGGWGGGWQSSLWSALAGRAAWVLWDAMPTSTRAAVARMVEHEADFAARCRIHYLRDAAGILLTPGNSGAEEVAWQGGAMQVALAMLPGHPHAGIWLTEMQRYALAAWARPQDVTA